MRLILSGLTLIYPFHMSIVIFLLYLKNNKKYKINMIISLCILAFIYERLDNSGDVSRYIISYNNYFSKQDFSTLFKSIENIIYYTWAVLNFLIKQLNLEFNYVTLISFIFYFYSIFSTIDLIDIKNNMNIKRKIILKFFLCTPLVILFSSYKNSIAFSLIIYGIYKKILKKKNANFFIILGCGYHISGIILLILYYISKKIKIKLTKSMVIILFLNSFIVKFLLKEFISRISSNILYIKKINTYIISSTYQYQMKNISEVLLYISMLQIFIFLIVSIMNINRKKIREERLNKYNNLLNIYMIFLIAILPYRTLAVRFITIALPLYFLLFYEVLLFFQKKKILRVLFFVLIDGRILGLFYIKSYIFNLEIIKKIIKNGG